MGIVWKVLAVVALVTLPMNLTLWRKSHTAPESYRFDMTEFSSVRVILRNGTCGFRLLNMPNNTKLNSKFRTPLRYDPVPSKSPFQLTSVQTGPFRVTWFVFPLWFSTSVLMLLGAIPIVRGPLRRSRRKRRGLCVDCGYNLHGNRSGRCPECGTRYRK